MATKYCNKCSTTLPIEQFGKNKAKADGLQSQCKSCRKVTNNAHYKNSENRRAAVRRNAKKTAAINKKYMNEAKAAGCCICEEKELCTLDFHHLDPKTKEFNIGAGGQNYSLNSLKEEIKKCIVVCSNCHRKLHAGLINHVGPIA